MRRNVFMPVLVLAVLCVAQAAMAAGALDEVWWEWMVRFLLLASGGIWNY